MTASDDLSHDPHLRAALRHAPDHALVPPAGVSQTILSAARQVHRPQRPAATPQPPVRITVARPRAFEWLRRLTMSPRLAGSLATGLVAALGLGLWIDLEHEPVIDRAPVDLAKQQHSGDAAPAAAPTKATEPSAATDANATRQTKPAPAAPAPRAEAPRAKRSARTNEADSELRAQAPATSPAPTATPQAPAVTPAAPAPVPERREDNSAREPASVFARDAAPPAAVPALMDAQQRDAAAKSEARMSSAAGRAAAAAQASTVEGGSTADAAADASPAFALLRRARSESATGSARWSWMAPGAPAVAPFDPAGQAWMARVVQATRGRWVDTAERAGAGDAVEARWWRDDWPQATLRIEADGVRWIEHSGRMRYAPLEPAALQRLRAL